jgi:NTE family protein
MTRKGPKLGLVLGSGGARGWAHFGVFRAMDEAGLRPDLIAGTSAGAMVAAFYAAGRIKDLHGIATQLKWKDVLYYFSDLSHNWTGLVDGRKIEQLFRSILGHLTIQELAIPLAIVATDVQSGRAVVLRKGDLVDAIRASISIPGIFSPVMTDGLMLVDGGLVDPVPVALAREMGAEKIIAVDVLGSVRARVSAETAKREAPTTRVAVLPEVWKKDASLVDNLKRSIQRISATGAASRPWLRKSRRMHLFDVLSNSIRIMEIQIAEASIRRDKPDILIRPGLADIGILEFQSVQEAEIAGYQATKQALKKFADTLPA